MSITLPDFAEVPLASPLAHSPEDYDRIRKAVAYITRKAQHQPSLEDIAGHVGLSVSHFHHLFRRWAGITPKDFLAAVTLDRARDLLRDSASILDATYELGLSGPARLHDLFVTHEAMTPGAFKTGGAGLTISYGFHPSPFGTALVMVAPLGLAGVAFADPGEEAIALADMRKRWPNAELREDSMVTAPYAGRIFDPSRWQADRPLNVVMIGTDFEVRVWRTLLRIPMGRATTYGDIASHIGNPKASRAVGAAVGRNPLSFVVPCHRVIGRSGELTGYHWGLTRKQAMLGWEGGRVRSGTQAA
ncbi:bifunctional helix-turn-helix domain-containing protein/methylated-DNA--[protein]-cysteine S-methyltransferase [Labrys sp. LIt4]|uniref:methylated-DNA--[protein]-cysteine S-methyltransferase n=1 Tax=Labrys sp. LIt4 TaxID=2821355 RepID=UPI001ADF59C2|nr:bifunctional helix-turn-helix domain-containing protein/methylated-DNA--[protein]-cysteine S-methyltransferase [Labrys sp. LIt4]MBP0581642.1 bifunctional helix-turn-helix domain-containing protein/methylated-DNA--[protein]-cysteine S-methyltransferase [Labrys sp. LIt4]